MRAPAQCDIALFAYVSREPSQKGMLDFAAKSAPKTVSAAPSAGGADISVTPDETLAFAPPRRLFAGRYSVNAPVRGYDAMPDGQ